MRIQAKDLPQHLKRNLASCYFVFGDEPLQQAESLDAIRTHAKQQGYGERIVFQITSSFEWASLLSAINTPSLFSEKCLIECRLEESKTNKPMSDTLAKLASLPDASAILYLFSAPKLDTKTQQSKGFMQLEQKGITICARTLSTKESLAWIETRLASTGLQATPEIIQDLFERTEGNLLAASQVIEKLLLCVNSQKTPLISLNDVQRIIETEARYSLYDLIDTALSGSVKRTSRIFSSLKNEGVDPVLALWVLTKEVRIILTLFRKMADRQISSALLNEEGIWKHREPLIRSFMNRSSPAMLEHILIKSKQVDDRIKGRTPGSPWDLLLTLYLMLARTNQRTQAF